MRSLTVACLDRFHVRMGGDVLEGSACWQGCLADFTRAAKPGLPGRLKGTGSRRLARSDSNFPPEGYALHHGSSDRKRNWPGTQSEGSGDSLIASESSILAKSSQAKCLADSSDSNAGYHRAPSAAKRPVINK